MTFRTTVALLALTACAHDSRETTAPTTPISDRSQRGAAPMVDARALREAYPPDARRRGLSGTATVRITVSDAGEVTAVVLRSEQPAGEGFGAACVALVRAHASGWQPRRNAEGTIVPFSYHCGFEAIED